MSIATDVSSTRTRRPWRKRHILLLFALIMLSWFGHFAWLRITLRPTPRPSYWAARAAALDTPSPDAFRHDRALAMLNALLQTATYQEEAVRLNIEWAQGGWGPPGELRRSDGPNLDEQIDISRPDFGKRRAAALDLFRRGWWIETEDALPMNVEAQRALGRVLLRHAESLLRNPGSSDHSSRPSADLQPVVEDYLGVLGAARQLCRTGGVSALQVAAWLEDTTADSIMRVPRDRMHEIDTLNLAQEVDRRRVRVERPSQYFERDRLDRHATLELYYVREGGNWMDVSAFVYMRMGGTWVKPDAPWRTWNLASPLFYTLDKARADIDAQFRRLDELTSLAAAVRNRNTDRPSPTITILNGNLWPVGEGAENAIEVLYSGHMHMDAVLTMLALERFHHEKSQYPDGLAELIPQYLPRLPIDYADLQPLRYRKAHEDYSLYSIGTKSGPDERAIPIRFK